MPTDLRGCVAACVLGAAVLASGCGGHDKRAPGAVCDALAIEAAGAEVLRQQADAQLVSALAAKVHLDEWTAHPEAYPDDTGLRSGAGNRVGRYQTGWKVLCEAEVIQYREMAALVARSPLAEDPVIGTALRQVTGLHCLISGDIFDGKMPSFQDRWIRRRGDAKAAVDSLVAACYATTGGARPAVTIEPPVLINETP